MFCPEWNVILLNFIYMLQQNLNREKNCKKMLKIKAMEYWDMLDALFRFLQ